MILLDTNVISELTRREPDAGVLSFLRRQPRTSLFTCSVCEAEIHYGLARMQAGRRRNELATRIAALLAGFASRILPFDSAAAVLYGAIRTGRQSAGRSISVQDAMIAAIARAHGVALATRDVSGFAGCGVEVVNPWSAGDA